MGAALVLALGAVVLGSSVSWPSAPHENKKGVSVLVSKPPVSAVSVTPGGGLAGVDPGAVLKVEYPKALGKGYALPSITPAVAGTWEQIGAYELVFAAAVPWPLGEM